MVVRREQAADALFETQRPIEGRRPRVPLGQLEVVHDVAACQDQDALVAQRSQAERAKIARGLGIDRAKLSHASVWRLRSSAFMGEPWPKKASGTGERDTLEASAPAPSRTWRIRPAAASKRPADECDSRLVARAESPLLASRRRRST